MVQIFGSGGSPEYEAAKTLQQLILAAWPQVQTNEAQDIRLIVNPKCHGQRVRDVDILLLADLQPGIAFAPFVRFTTPYGTTERADRVEVRSLCLAIEVKDHSPESVRFVGKAVDVKYHDRWHSASEQNEGQRFSVKGFLESQGLQAPWVTGLIWLRNVANSELPAPPHNILGAQLTWERLLNTTLQETPPWRQGGEWVMDAFGGNASSPYHTFEVFTRLLEPSRLDRQRLEQINQRAVEAQHLEKIAGQKLLLLRGGGGTGKTVRLLQLAKRLYDDEASRILILTYNKALVADIRRLLTITGIVDGIDTHSIQVQTAHAFFHEVLTAMGLVVSGAPDFLEQFGRLKGEALEYLRAGAATPADLRAPEVMHRQAFSWDYVFVDEGQDWPTDERELLRLLYPYDHLVVADGLQQLVRSAQPADWREGLEKTQVRVEPLKTCLRMKANLARFANAFARGLGLAQTQAEPNPEALGGRVIVIDGHYLTDRAFHDRLVTENAEAGNSPVDMLFCVPPSLVRHPHDSTARSVAADVFENWGYSVWDGVAVDVRDSYPTALEQLRIIQYDSCRGLEGWITVNLQLDDLYQFKRDTYSQVAAADAGGFADEALQAERHAARWTMIPILRAMDTLVVQIHQPYSTIRDALSYAAAECPDVVDWRTPL